jgi:hypothetical protein
MLINYLFQICIFNGFPQLSNLFNNLSSNNSLKIHFLENFLYILVSQLTTIIYNQVTTFSFIQIPIFKTSYLKKIFYNYQFNF